jgi:hypothetical protein
VRFQVLTAASIKTTVSWNVAPCSPVEVYQCFRGTCCLHHQVHCRVHNSPSVDPIVSQMNAVHTRPPCLSYIHFNIILPSLTGCSKWFLLFRFLRPKPSTHCALVSNPIRVTRFVILTLLDVIILIIIGTEHKLICNLCSCESVITNIKRHVRCSRRWQCWYGGGETPENQYEIVQKILKS